MDEPIKALSLWQPWASLVALKVKTVETRSWSTAYRGPLAIHAAKTLPSYDKRYVSGATASRDPWGDWRLHFSSTPSAPMPKGLPSPPEYGESSYSLPLGAVVATCTLVDVVPIVGIDDELTVAWQRHVAPTRRGELWLWNGPSETENLSTGRPTWLHDDITDQLPYGDYSPGRYAWLLADIEPVDPPVLARGRQGLWTWQP